MTGRTERDIVADTIVALLCDQHLTLARRVAACATAGISTPDFEAALARRKTKGFVAPSGDIVHPLADILPMHHDQASTLPTTRLNSVADKVLKTLIDHGPVTDPAGHALSKLKAMIDWDGAAGTYLSAVLRDMEDRGFIVRDIKGRRTFRIAVAQQARA